MCVQDLIQSATEAFPGNAVIFTQTVKPWNDNPVTVDLVVSLGNGHAIYLKSETLQGLSDDLAKEIVRRKAT